jgi:hypothetical protein
LFSKFVYEQRLVTLVKVLWRCANYVHFGHCRAKEASAWGAAESKKFWLSAVPERAGKSCKIFVLVFIPRPAGRQCIRRVTHSLETRECEGGGGASIKLGQSPEQLSSFRLHPYSAFDIKNVLQFPMRAVIKCSVRRVPRPSFCFYMRAARGRLHFPPPYIP